CSSPTRFPRPSRSATASCCCRRIPARSRPSSTACRAATMTRNATRSWKNASTGCCSRTASKRRNSIMAELQTPRTAGRAERYLEPVADESFGVVQKPLSAWERLYNIGALRKLFLLAVLALVWEVYARSINNPLLFPTFGATVGALYDGLVHGALLLKAWTSIRVLLVGYAAGIGLAALLTVLAITTRLGTDLLETLTSMFNPLPAIALLPLAL